MSADNYSEESRMDAARQVARWHLGDRYWADRLIAAYKDPERALVQLRLDKDQP